MYTQIIWSGLLNLILCFNLAAGNLMKVEAETRCNETVHLSAGDLGYLIVHDQGNEILYCETTLKSSDQVVISMRFMNIQYPSCSQSEVELVSIQGTEEYEHYPVFQSQPHFCGRADPISDIVDFEQYYDQEWRLVMTNMSPQNVLSSATFAFSAHYYEDEPRWPFNKTSETKPHSTTISTISTKLASSSITKLTRTSATLYRVATSTKKTKTVTPSLTNEPETKTKKQAEAPTTTTPTITTPTTTTQLTTTPTTKTPTTATPTTTTPTTTATTTTPTTITTARKIITPSTDDASSTTKISVITTTTPKVKQSTTPQRGVSSDNATITQVTDSGNTSSSTLNTKPKLNRCSCHVGLSRSETIELELTLPPVYIQKSCAVQISACQLHCLTEAQRENLDHLGSLASVSEMLVRDGVPTKTITTIHNLMCKVFHKPYTRRIRPILYSQVEGCVDSSTSDGNENMKSITQLYNLRFSRNC